MKKLLKNRGSVLFIVLVVMSILMLTASATYFIVRNQHGSVETRYGGEQSYQTALSISSAVSDYLDTYLIAVSKGNGDLAASENDLVEKMLALPLNGTLGTAAISDKLVDIGMGDYTVEIKKTKRDTADETTTHTFEITTLAEVDGELTRVVQVKSITTGPADYFTRFFTSTGKRAEDVVIGCNQIYTTVYLENDYTLFQDSATCLNDGLYSSGSVHDAGMQYSTQPSEVVIAENFLVTGGDAGSNVMRGGGTLTVGGNMDCGKHIGNSAGNPLTINVIGDFISDHNANNSSVKVGGNAAVGGNSSDSVFYVNGDLHVKSQWNNGTFYVKGDVYLPNALGSAAGITCGGNLYVNGVLADPATLIAAWHFTADPTLTQPWSDDDIAALKVDIAAKTARQSYADWEAEEYFDDMGITAEVTPDFSGTSTVYKITESCILHEITNPKNHAKLIIDTSAAGKDIYIKLQPTSGDSFSFGAPDLSVLIKGRYSVIFVLPEDVNFVANERLFIAHFDWAKVISGETEAQLLDNARSSPALSSLGKTSESAVRGMLEKNAEGQWLINRGSYSELHNNIYLVTSGKDNVLNFDTDGPCLWGYIYAPNNRFVITVGSSSFSFLGGMIVGAYNYVNITASLAFTTPYDYNNLYPITDKADIVKYLMGVSNGSGGGADNMLKGFANLGYK